MYHRAPRVPGEAQEEWTACPELIPRFGCIAVWPPPTMRTTKANGYTLAELLVVIAIMAVATGLVLPAVHNVRAAASRAACQNNVRQIGLALHAYHDTNERFPSGATPRRRGEPLPLIGWMARLLPFADQQPLWDQTRTAYAVHQLRPFEPPHAGVHTPVQIYGCPSDERTTRPQQTHKGMRVALAGYVGVSGTDLNRTDGVLFPNSKTRITDVRDGSSSTLMVGERPPSPDFWYGWWYAGTGQRGSGSGNTLLGVREVRVIDHQFVRGCALGPYHFVQGRPEVYCDMFHFWSLHPGGAHFAFADGSVRFLAYSADAVLPALATRAGGETVTVPD